MDKIYQEFEEVMSEISSIDDMSLALVDAMKNCLAENNNAYHLLVSLEILNQRTSSLHEKAETLSYKILDKSSFMLL